MLFGALFHHLVIRETGDAELARRAVWFGALLPQMYVLVMAYSEATFMVVSVAFYGMVRVPEAWRGDQLAEPLATAAQACSTLAIFGSADPFTPADDIAALSGCSIKGPRRCWSR